MDMCGLHAPECLGIDDLLDFSNADLFTSTTDSNISHYHLPLPLNSSHHSASTTDADPPNTSTTFSDDLCVPSDDVAELEWLSRFVDDSFSDFPANELSGTPNFQPEPSIPGKTRSKRSRTASTWTLPPKSDIPATVKSKSKNDTNYVKKKTSSPTASSEVRRCAHCASENTPQWREGPLGPKTLCNACGVRYKSGRLVPEYRPAASPTFVLTQHSNSHRKVMELRRQKEVTALDITNHHHQFYRHPHDFQVC